MSACHLEFLVEEPSMEDFLNSWLPRILPENCTFSIHPHQGKPALLKRLEARLRGYSSWVPNNYRIFVVVDCDRDDCKELKSRLEECCKNAGLQSRRTANNPNWQVVTRIAIEELEAWYFGDWPAVTASYPRVSTNVCNKKAYRDPDAIQGGTSEAFERVLQRHGYFSQGLTKKQAATNIGKHIDASRNKSHSFAVFYASITELCKIG